MNCLALGIGSCMTDRTPDTEIVPPDSRTPGHSGGPVPDTSAAAASSSQGRAPEVVAATPFSGPQRIVAGALAGIAAGGGMFVTLGLFSIGMGGAFWYPLKAVHAMMSGRRVLPNFRGALYGSQPQDYIVEPILFLIPALAVGIATAAFMRRRARSTDASGPWWMAAPTAAILTAVFFIVFIAVLGYAKVGPSTQRISSGQGIRELGLTAWIVAHVVYTAVLVALMEPIARALRAFSNRGAAADAEREASRHSS